MHCVYTVKCKCVVKPLLIDLAINKVKVLLGMERVFLLTFLLVSGNAS